MSFCSHLLPTRIFGMVGSACFDMYNINTSWNEYRGKMEDCITCRTSCICSIHLRTATNDFRLVTSYTTRMPWAFRKYGVTIVWNLSWPGVSQIYLWYIIKKIKKKELFIHWFYVCTCAAKNLVTCNFTGTSSIVTNFTLNSSMLGGNRLDSLSDVMNRLSKYVFPTSDVQK